MSGKKAKEARGVQAPQKRADSNPTFWKSWKGGLVGAAVLAVIAGSFVVPKLVNGDSTPAAATHAGMNMGAGAGEGLKAGARVPQFAEQNVETGRPITSRALYPRKTLLFFSEGVMCQACLEQIQGLQKVGAQLERRGIQLVSITPDSKDELKQAASQYGITTPLISDSDRNMSSAFNTLGKGMHGDTPGHAFVLIDKGKVLWYRDYWLPPYRSMYVNPKKLLKDIPA